MVDPPDEEERGRLWGVLGKIKIEKEIFFWGKKKTKKKKEKKRKKKKKKKKAWVILPGTFKLIIN